MAASKSEPMSVQTLLEGLADVTRLPELQVLRLQDDSRLVQPGDVYCAIVSVNPNGKHGLAYAKAAVAAGAVAVLYEPVLGEALPELSVPCVAVEQLSEHLGCLASRLFDEPSADLCVTGITGTDGKTSVAQLLAQAHTLRGQPADAKAPQAAKSTRAAMLGTLGYGELDALHTATHTTPPPLVLQAWLAQFQQTGIQYVNMEVSSHALVQNRVGGVQFDTAVLTNLGRDHLDYHGDLAAYQAAKALLFAWPGLQHAVLNLDDAFGRILRGQIADSVTVVGYARDEQALNDCEQYVYYQSSPTGSGLSVRFATHAGEANIQSSLLGDFNANNLAAVLSVLLANGTAFDDAITILPKLQSVAGRMARYGGEQQGLPLVVVDYAHTANALHSALRALRPHTHGQLVCLFGCGGDRDRGKRQLMAAAAEQHADRVVLTSDNPRTENPAIILQEVQQGFERMENVVIEIDRAKAIQQAISSAKTGDVILVAGKGHENYQIIGTTKHHFDDAEVVQAALAEWAA